jgi:hypothetical protein
MDSVGIVGLGQMGTPMSAHLLEAGFAVAGYDIEPARVHALEAAGGRGCGSAREVASGRADLSEHEPAWRRLLAIPNIGNWTIEMLAFEGQGRDDMLPALDVAYLKLVGALAGLGRRATEDEVRAFFAPYEEHAALAGIYALHGHYI